MLGRELGLAFDIYDYVSVYLLDWQLDWIRSVYLDHSQRSERFKSLCQKYVRNTHITSAAVYVAKYLLERHQLLMFPWVKLGLRSRPSEGNWRMLLFDETGVVISKVVMNAVVDTIRKGGSLVLQLSLDKSVYELCL